MAAVEQYQSCEGALPMERDLMVMIYGAIMGVVGSILTSIVTALFQLWLERREYDRRQSQKRHRQLRQIHLPTDEDIRTINAEQQGDQQPEPARTLAGAGSVLVSLLLSTLVVYQTHDAMLGFVFSGLIGFLLMNRVLRFFKR
jgi:predicted PurR-regulated permease PerM